MKFKDFCFRVSSYLKYWYKAQNNLYLHTPYLFNFYNQLQKPIPESIAIKIASYRKFLNHNDNEINLKELGSQQHGLIKIKVSERYNKTSINEKIGQILFNTAQYFNGNILELGTSLGVSCLYFSQALNDKSITTIDINSIENIIAPYNDYFKNVIFKTGCFEDEIPLFCSENITQKVVFIDGNHTFESTTTYVRFIEKILEKESVVIIDDIRYNSEMHLAWKYICEKHEYNYAIDLGSIGMIINANNKAPKQYFYIKI
jgi:predicted O-methyltransferase YrrM